MTSPQPASNLPQTDEPTSVNGDERTIGGRAPDPVVYVIDRAVLELRGPDGKPMKRGPFIVDAAYEKAVAVLRERGIPLPENAPPLPAAS